jgi:hypothetical protein
MRRMLIHSSNGQRHVRDDAVIFIHRDQAMGRWCAATLVLDSGEEISALVAAVEALQAKLADALPPAA